MAREAMICIFAKPPVAGQVKTRLAAAVGDLRSAELAQAFLDDTVCTDAALGPAEDGGFYLLALRRCPPGLLEGLPWSAGDTCARTLARLRERGLHPELLEPWFDVDRPDDLVRLRAAIASGEVVAPRSAAALGRLG